MIVLYTAIFGACDSLKPAPAGVRAVCFTDDPALRGRGWEIVGRPTELRARRAARLLKMTPHELFPEATASVWVDGSIAITDWPALMRDTESAEIACFPHPDRSSCYDEGATVVRLKIAHRAKVQAALELYRRDGFAPTALSTTGLLFRRHSPRMTAFNELWRDHLDRFGTNDQVHVDYVAWKNGVPVTHLPGHYRANAYARYDKDDHHRRRKPQFRLEADCEHYMDTTA